MNKNLILIGGVVAAYLLWKKSTKTETVVETVVEDENAQYDVSRENPNKTRSFDGYDYASGGVGSQLGIDKKGGIKTCHCGGTQGDERFCTGSCKDCCTKRRMKDINKGRV